MKNFWILKFCGNSKFFVYFFCVWPNAGTWQTFSNHVFYQRRSGISFSDSKFAFWNFFNFSKSKSVFIWLKIYFLFSVKKNRSCDWRSNFGFARGQTFISGTGIERKTSCFWSSDKYFFHFSLIIFMFFFNFSANFKWVYEFGPTSMARSQRKFAANFVRDGSNSAWQCGIASKVK